MDTQQLQNNRRKKKRALFVAGMAFVVGGIALLFYLHYKAYHISTDDAFIDARVHTIAARIDGIVESVMVEDNQRVERGDVLLKLDPNDYKMLVKAHEAALEEARAKLKELEATVDIEELSLLEAGSAVEAARANLQVKRTILRQAEQDLERAKVLFENEAFSKELYDKAVTAYDVAVADRKAAMENVSQAEQALKTRRAAVRRAVLETETQRSKIEQQTVARDEALLSVSYTSVTAPASGYVTRKGVESGNHVMAGQPLMAVVDLDHVWINANYKETALGKIMPGQPVTFKVDAWRGATFHGTVQSIMAGTGAAFSVFPSENATGNYVKVVQRVPVKIVPDKDTFGQYEPRVGMSVIPVIDLQ